MWSAGPRETGWIGWGGGWGIWKDGVQKKNNAPDIEAKGRGSKDAGENGKENNNEKMDGTAKRSPDNSEAALEDQPKPFALEDGNR